MKKTLYTRANKFGRKSVLLSVLSLLIRSVVPLDPCAELSGYSTWYFYNRGSCYFRTLTTFPFADSNARCDAVWPGSVGAVIPDEILYVNELYPKYMTWVRVNAWLNGYQTSAVNEPYGDWVWKFSGETDIEVNITAAEMSRRFCPSSVDVARGANAQLMWMSSSHFGICDGMITSNTAAFCQKRITDHMHFKVLAGKVGVGAYLKNMTLNSYHLCQWSCQQQFGCLSYSYTTGNCYLHYVTDLDTLKLTVVATGRTSDRFGVIDE